MNRWYGLLTLAYCGIIFALSSIEKPTRAFGWIAVHDLAVHAAVYAGLGWLAGMTVRKGDARLPRWQQWAAPAAFVAVYGATDEVHQLFVPGRFCALSDWIADVAGGVVVQLAFPLYARWRDR